MSWIERMIAPLAPNLALKRLTAKTAFDANIKAYQAATRTRTHRAEKQSMTANTSVGRDALSLREQARKLDEDHDLVVGALDKLEERVIGGNGIMVEPQPRDNKGEVLTKLQDDIRNRWASWSLKCDVTGVFTRPELERMVLRSAMRDGEVFCQLVRGNVIGLTHPNPNGTPFSLEALEADFVPLHLTELGKRIRQGIELDAWGRAKAYHVFYDHPGDHFGLTSKTKRVSSDNMLHLAHRHRLHQLRGVSALHAVITRLADIKDYEESERVAARIAAALAFYIKKGTPDLYTPPESPTNREIPFAPGASFDDLRQGEEIGMIESNRPNTHLTKFRDGQIRMIAAGIRGTTYSSVARDYNGTYSAQRQELVEGQEGIAVSQQWFVGQWSRPVYRAWLEMELLRTDNPLKLPSNIDKSTLFDAVYLAPTMPWIDPVKETKGWKERIKGGGTTQSQWIRASGGNPAEVKRQRAAEIKENKELGLHFDTDITPTGEQANGTNGNHSTAREHARGNDEK